MPVWAIPLIQIGGSALIGGMMAAGTQLSMGGSWKQVLGAFLTGAASTGGAHAMGSPFLKSANGQAAQKQG